MKSEMTSFGVQELIDQIRREGIEAAKIESNELIAQAKKQAEETVAAAKVKAERIISDAKRLTDRETQAAKDALGVAYRDLILDIKGHLLNRFSDEVGRLVKSSVDQPDVLNELVLEAARRLMISVPPEKPEKVDIALNDELLSLHDISSNPDKASQGDVANFVFSLQRKLLEQGVHFTKRNDLCSGINIILKEKNIEVDVSDQAIADLLLEYLNPRFRAVLEGIIHS